MSLSNAAVLEKVTRRYGRITALHQVDLRIRQGAFVLLAGPNGAGKTTLLSLLAGLGRPSQGRVRVQGGDPGSDVCVRRRIGLLSHKFMLYEQLSGLENLEFFARLYGVHHVRARARDALVDAGLGSRGNSLVRTYSRGMKQRLALARACLHQPELLLLDEPFVGLDRDSVGRLSARLMRLHAAGTTCVLVTHRLEQAAALADHTVLLSRGRTRLQEWGPWDSSKHLEAAYARQCTER